MKTCYLLLALFALPAIAAERLLLAAENQVIEIDRAGQVTEVLKHPGHNGIWDAWRLPDGGLFYVHRHGLAVFDRDKKLVLEVGNPEVEATGGTVLQGGKQFAILDSKASEVRVVDRQGNLVSRTPIPDLGAEPLFPRYRMIRKAIGREAFWIAQHARNTLLEVEMGSGKILATIPLALHLTRTPPGPHLTFAALEAGDGTLWASTATGLQFMHLDAKRNRLASWTASDLGLAARYFLGMQMTLKGTVLLACGDYHLKTAAEGRDLLVEITPTGKVVWKFTRDQLRDQIEGFVEPKTGLEEMRITNVHLYDTDRLADCLNVKR